jgi:hypothetical protein
VDLRRRPDRHRLPRPPCAEEVDDWTSQWWQPAALEHIGLRLPAGPVAEVAVEPLAACTLTTDGLVTPMLARIRQERAALQAKAAPRQRQAAHAERARQAPLAAVLAERNARKDLERARTFLEQSRGELEQRLAAAAYAEPAHPTPASRQVQVSPAQLHALVYGILRRALPAGRPLTPMGSSTPAMWSAFPKPSPTGSRQPSMPSWSGWPTST